MYYQTNSTNNDTFFKQHHSILNIHVIYKCMTSQHKIVYNINKSYTQKILQQVIQKLLRWNNTRKHLTTQKMKTTWEKHFLQQDKQQITESKKTNRINRKPAPRTISALHFRCTPVLLTSILAPCLYLPNLANLSAPTKNSFKRASAQHQQTNLSAS